MEWGQAQREQGGSETVLLCGQKHRPQPDQWVLNADSALHWLQELFNLAVHAVAAVTVPGFMLLEV